MQPIHCRRVHCEKIFSWKGSQGLLDVVICNIAPFMLMLPYLISLDDVMTTSCDEGAIIGSP